MLAQAGISRVQRMCARPSPLQFLPLEGKPWSTRLRRVLLSGSPWFRPYGVEDSACFVYVAVGPRLHELQ